MIQSVKITNHRVESVTLELRNPEKSGFLIENIEGLDPGKADILTTEMTTMDGALFDSARAKSRNVVFSLIFLENPAIKDTRLNSYKYFPITKRIEILVTTSDRICKTYGYVESNEPKIFSKREGTIISVICPDAYLYALEKQITSFSALSPVFEFPFSNESTSTPLIEFGDIEMGVVKNIYYLGDVSVGISIQIHAIGNATNISIINTEKNETISLDSSIITTITGEDIHSGDDIIISTVKGSKYAILIRDGIEYNIFNAIEENPDWFQLEKGDNIFTYTADSGASNLQFTIENDVVYEGV